MAACVSIGKYVRLGRVDGQVKEWVWASRGLFGDEIAVLPIVTALHHT